MFSLNISSYRGIKSTKFSLGGTIDLGKKLHNLSNKLQRHLCICSSMSPAWLSSLNNKAAVS